MLRKALIFLGLSVLVSVGAVAYLLEEMGRTPRELAPYIERRVEGHNPLIVGAGNWVGQTLRTLDRMEGGIFAVDMLKQGAHAIPTAPIMPPETSANEVTVSSPEQARVAIGNAKPGDTITFLPGTYAFSGSNIFASKAGTAAAPITLRAGQLGTVTLLFSLSEGFLVSAPYWTIENLRIEGKCQHQSNCEHAFHVVGKAHHFIARNNVIVDFNAHFKINKSGDAIPDDGLIEYNTISNTSARRTESSVTLIDLVAASRWRIRHNVITDFIKDGSDRISYGAFVKGGGSDNRIEQNVVICEHRLRGQTGKRVGLSLGGGGTGQAYCPNQRCITEQDRGVVASNLILACSDDGIYLNKAAASRIINNTLIDTGGIVVRFPESTADVDNNLVDGKIRARDGGLIRESNNRDTHLSSLFVGYHPVRALFRQASVMDLQWHGKPQMMATDTEKMPDLCGASRGAQSLIGAFDDFGACLAPSDAPTK